MSALHFSLSFSTSLTLVHDWSKLIHNAAADLRVTQQVWDSVCCLCIATSPQSKWLQKREEIRKNAAWQLKRAAHSQNAYETSHDTSLFFDEKGFLSLSLKKRDATSCVNDAEQQNKSWNMREVVILHWVSDV